MLPYRSISLIPPLVKRAKNLAGQMQFKRNCSNGSGRLLRLLSSQFQSGMIGEIGSGCGVGSAWIISAMAPGTSFVTIESSKTLSAVVRTLVEPYPFAKVINSEWHEIVRFGPFNLVYVPAHQAADCAPEVLLQSLRIGGTMFIDGLLPVEQASYQQKDKPDPLRSSWLDEPRLLATEIYVSSVEAVILATRIE